MGKKINTKNIKIEDCYLILKLDETATIKDIKKRYRHLALKYHPDRYDGSHAEIKFYAIHKSYCMLLEAHDKKELIEEIVDSSEIHWDTYPDDLEKIAEEEELEETVFWYGESAEESKEEPKEKPKKVDILMHRCCDKEISFKELYGGKGYKVLSAKCKECNVVYSKKRKGHVIYVNPIDADPYCGNCGTTVESGVFIIPKHKLAKFFDSYKYEKITYCPKCEVKPKFKKI